MKEIPFKHASIILMTALSSVMLLLISWLTWSTLSRTVGEQYEYEARLLLDHGSTLLANRLEEAALFLDSLASHTDPAELRHDMGLFAPLLPDGVRIAAGYDSGEIITSGGEPYPASFDPRTRPWYIERGKLSGGPVFSELFFDYLDQEIVFAVSMPMDPDTAEGTLAILYPVEVLGKIIAGFNEEWDGELLIIGREGEVLAHEENRHIGLRLSPVEGKPGFPGTVIEGVDYRMYRKALSSTGMYIAAAIPESAVLGKVRKDAFILIFYEFLFLLVYAFFVYFFGSLLLNPLADFASMMNRVETGDYSIRAGAWRFREIASLSRSFNSMLEQIENRNAILKSREVEIKNLAYYDTLTKLPNRLLLKKTLGRLLENSGGKDISGAMMYIDLDRFKIINDTMGHSTGDKVLMQIAARLTASLRHGQMAARLGGDEFILLFPHIDSVELMMQVADRLLHQLNQPVYVGSNSFDTGASIGIVFFPLHGNSPDLLLKKADVAMYRAKQDGKNNWKIFEEHLEHEILEKMEIKNGIREALKAESFEVHYQPQFDSYSGEMCGAEALLRPGCRRLSSIPVSKIIAVAEETGHIAEIETFVLKKAVRFAQEHYRRTGSILKISVNISALHIMHRDFVDKVAGIIGGHDLPEVPIELEITETAMLNSHQNTIEKLHALNEIGIRLHMDDFGTGYSSLNYLQELPISFVKIDRSFVQKIDLDARTNSIISLIISLSHSLKLKVIAEGVETEDQLACLKENGCDIIQGFLLSRPLSPAMFQHTSQMV